MEALFADQTLAAIERCCWNGSIQSAKALVQGMQTGLFSQEEKDAVVAKIDEFLRLHGKI
jgi:outer membrane protein assembly factor BamD (BamD/ComL family)